MLILGVLAPVAQAQAAAHRLMVVAIPNKAKPDFNSQVVAHVIHPLAERVPQVPGADAHNAVVKSGLARPALRTPRNAQRVGRLAGASHVLVVEAQGHGARQSVHASLVDVASGRVVTSVVRPLPGGALTAAIAAHLVAPVVAKIGAAKPLVAAAPPPPPREPPPPASDDAWKAGAKGADDAPAGKDPEAGKKAKNDDDDDEAPEEGEAAKKKSAANDDEEADRDPDAGGAAGAAARWRSAGRISVGAEFMQRQGTLTATLPSGVLRLPGYQGDATNSNPFFPLPHLDAEFFPLAIGGKGRAVEGLGVRGDFQVSYIKSILSNPNNATTPTIIPSTIVSLKIAAAFRYVLWNSPLATDVELDFGLRYLAFPLTGGQFPGVAYTAPYLALLLHIPLATEHLALVAFGALDFALGAGGDAPKDLSVSKQQKGGGGFEIGGGLRVNYKHLELKALVRLESLNASFTGVAALPGIASQYQPSNVTLDDRYIGILTTLGWVF